MFSIIPLVSADSFGTYVEGECVNLVIACSNCTYVNISSIEYPNSTNAISNIATTKDGVRYNYTYCNTEALGQYNVYSFGDDDGIVTISEDDYFEITRTGEKVSLSNSILVIAFLIVAIICLVLGYNFDTSYWLIKTFFYFCSILVGILAINSATIIASESTNLFRMGTMGLLIGIILMSIFFIFIFVFAFIEIIKALKKKKEIRWNY